MRLTRPAWAALTALSFSAPLSAGEVRAAVASNFATPMQALTAEFTHATGHHVMVTTGATGKLYAQIENGAPFDVFLAADESTPAKLESQGLAIEGTRFTYAVGKLVLYSAKPDYVDTQGAILAHASFAHLAIANPKLAPYGAAAVAVLSALRHFEVLRPKIVQGENIAQTLEFVVSGNAELGFVALSQVWVQGAPRPGSMWIVPEELYPPLRQDAVELRDGAKNPAALALLTFLQSDGARAIIAAQGYGLSPTTPKRGGR
jgi:molybdate transport system substrate-binding protein